jgi:hypothetical protein
VGVLVRSPAGRRRIVSSICSRSASSRSSAREDPPRYGADDLDAVLRAGSLGRLRDPQAGAKQGMPDELAAILRAAWESGEVAVGPDEYVIPNRRAASVRRPERSSKVIWETVRRVAERANVRSHAHALRAAFAVRFNEAHPDQLLTLKDLLGHARLETTLVYLRRRKKQLAMERVRDLSWGDVGGGCDGRGRSRSSCRPAEDSVR